MKNANKVSKKDIRKVAKSLDKKVDYESLKLIEINKNYVSAIEAEILRTAGYIESMIVMTADEKTVKQYKACLKILYGYKTARLHWTIHSGKLEWIKSMNSDCTVNPYCLARMANGENVCSQCFANSLLAFRLSLHCHMLVNSYILNSRLLTPEEIPAVKYSKKQLENNPELFVRVESYGDAGSVLQVVNELLVMVFNPEFKFGAWTKNLNFWHIAVQKLGFKPKNLSLGFSSIKLNEPTPIPEKFVYLVDFRFTVFSAEFLKDHPELIIDCGGLACIPCGKCYNPKCRKSVKKIPGTNIADIYELLRPKKKMIQQIGCKNA